MQRQGLPHLEQSRRCAINADAEPDFDSTNGYFHFGSERYLNAHGHIPNGDTTRTYGHTHVNGDIAHEHPNASRPDASVHVALGE